MSSLVPASAHHRMRLGSSPGWPVRVIHGLGLVVTVPVVAFFRLFRERRAHDESIFEQSNRAVLTALELALVI